MNILIIGRNQWVIDAAKAELEQQELKVYGALSVKEAETALNQTGIDHAFIGPGLDLNIRLKIIRSIFTKSSYTTVHLKDHSTGPEGGLNFVKAILAGLKHLKK